MGARVLQGCVFYVKDLGRSWVRGAWGGQRSSVRSVPPSLASETATEFASCNNDHDHDPSSTVHLGWLKVAHLELYRLDGINRYEHGTFSTL